MKIRAGGAAAVNRNRTLKSSLLAYLFLLPAFGLFFTFVCFPVVQTFFISLTNWDGIGPKTFVGLQNYLNLFTVDDLFWKSLRNTLIWAAASATIPVGMGLVIANLLVRGKVRFGRWFQIIFFLPQVISMVIAAVIWKWIYDPVFGPLNVILKGIGLDSLAIGWLGSPKLVMVALFIIYIWMTYGFCVLIFTAALQGVDPQTYDAANIDGCGSWGQFRHVTIPGLNQSITTVITLMTVWSFSIFDLVMTTTRGGPGFSSYVISYYVYNQGFMVNRVGFGAAASIILTIIVLVASRVIIYVREKAAD
jgi:raffinose/stachyose/melibiose transport system permease protein